MAENNNGTPGIDYAAMSAAFAAALENANKNDKKGRTSVTFDPSKLEDFKEGLDRIVKSVKESQPGFKTLSQIASGAQVSIQDNAGAFAS